MNNLVKVGRIYKHYRGDKYLVQSIATSASPLYIGEQPQQLVVYQSIRPPCTVYTRPIEEFTSTVYIGKERKLRFTLFEETKQ